MLFKTYVFHRTRLYIPVKCHSQSIMDSVQQKSSSELTELAYFFEKPIIKEYS